MKTFIVILTGFLSGGFMETLDTTVQNESVMPVVQTVEESPVQNENIAPVVIAPEESPAPVQYHVHTEDCYNTDCMSYGTHHNEQQHNENCLNNNAQNGYHHSDGNGRHHSGHHN